MNKEELIKLRNELTKERDQLQNDFRTYDNEDDKIRTLSKLIEDLDEVIWLT